MPGKLLVYFILFILALLPGISISQTLLYEQDFEGNNPFLNYRLENRDKGVPVDPLFSSLNDSAWVVRTLPGYSHSAIATSSYDPGITPNDWFITPAIRLGSHSWLSWNAMSLTAGSEDTYEVYVSNSSQTVNGCLINFPVAVIDAEDAGSFMEHTLDLADLGYTDLFVYVGFRLMTPGAGDKLAIDDIRVQDDSLQDAFSLTFVVNMSRYIADSVFRPSTDTVDIAGNFNGWDGTKHILSLVPDTDSSIYSITIPGFMDGDVLEFKYRINSSWNDTALEFPYGGPNRVWLVSKGMNTFTAFYNEAGSVSGLGEGSSRPDAVSIYPNPVKDWIQISVSRDIQHLRILTCQGNMIRELQINSLQWSEDLSDLPPGMYIFQFTDKRGRLDSHKVIKQ